MTQFLSKESLSIETSTKTSKSWRSYKSILLVLFGLAAVLAMVTSASRPVLADHTTLALLPSPLLLSPGDQGVLDVWMFGLDGSERITGYELTLGYDPAVIIVDAVTGGDSQHATTPAHVINNEAGRVRLNSTRTQAGPAEDVLIARISVTAAGNLGASTTLTFESVVLTDSLDRPVETGIVLDGQAAMSNIAVMIGTSVVAKGESVTVPVTINFSPEGGLASYNISIGYDNSIIQIDDTSAGEPPFGGPPIFSVN